MEIIRSILFSQFSFPVCLCVRFLKAITTGGVTYNDKPWHRECFTCIGCKRQLAGQRFTSRENYSYCLECFSNLYAKKCVGCTKPITSKSGRKYSVHVRTVKSVRIILRQLDFSYSKVLNIHHIHSNLGYEELKSHIN